MGTLHLMCGKIAAGKSTLTAKLGRVPETVVISEDALMAALFKDELKTVADYVRCSKKLRDAIGPVVVATLKAGVSVVLDFPANTLTTRGWMKSLIAQSGCDHVLHFLDVPDAVCKQRLRERNAAGTHDFAASDAEFDQITAYFVAPGADEGFHVQVHRPAE